MNMSTLGTPLVTISNLSKSFGQGDARVDALKQVTLQVYAGQVVGLLGPSGSGKSTLLNIIGCILEPSSGRMELDGTWPMTWPVVSTMATPESQS